ncbi:MAG: tyrosine--tRNA ligase [Omnitrophica bacterium RIFCSPLOWO2_12_FULL_44_17]|uniref:Tyrosine--tRNA ligase n=1 Tax=Candidatus Danuiimicrobium aquiferis TaxID=1801832 RepID=A0A1G1L1J4_9BACT|nr:MAG: tyrosine--tRNA ligase [Omnitrophica bacterium RIFCSPHIGHO2_02_FULL_45_28]OGW89948.1 MAG: tyrosine--tRNA ligase [Omnitrophica bacterium RIFCSPHIGHO2_12_FULL_44_12]OGW98998.1 MAG: tyrosine--tRNA ligase [Omnitrophica bacterium RIFCSPLOWO2_12_FULL_44_17]OGX04177.1 MAG: tyrosine--tRNA ligase [Omnitrophica bacterium RIFCSPLOWO2_02_FULL_44_11]
MDQFKIFSEGVIDLITSEDLQRKLKENRPLRIKYGADPSAPDLHLGHTVPLRKLRQLQELGHKIVFLIGDFTARIGDPSFKSATRMPLSPEQVKQNAKTYEEQVFRILDRSQTEVRYNSEWLDQLKPDDFLKLASKYTVARILERDDFSKRYKSGQPITILEFLYPLLQGYDSVVLKADLELGGTDQKFNLLVGRELQRDWGQEAQVVMTLPLIEGLDGKDKMSKSLGNHIAIQDSPDEMFGKLMSIPDELMPKYYRYTTGGTVEAVEKFEKDLKSGSLHPRDAKVKLAKAVTGFFHCDKEADQAEENFSRLFRDKELPEGIEEVSISTEAAPHGEIDLVMLLNDLKLTSSKGEARRLIQQGGVKIDQKKVSDVNAKISLKSPVVIQCGKRKFVRVKIK